MVLREHPLLDPMKDLVTISMVAITCFGIAVHPSVPAQNLKELIDHIKANPGNLSYGSAATDGTRDGAIDKDAAVAIGHEVLEVLTRHGLAPAWNGKHAHRIALPLTWQRRRPT